MGPFKTYIDSALVIWNDATAAARVGIVLLAILVVGGIGGIGYWSTLPNYVSLGDIDDDKMDDLMDSLEKAGIEHELSAAGGFLKVDRRNLSRAKLIARQLGVADSESSSSLMGSAWESPMEKKDRIRKQLENRLANTLQKFHVVDKAVVILNTPKKSGFERRISAPSASVMLTLVYKKQLSSIQANQIASLVAYAVEDLQPEAVQITDSEGKNYSIAGAGSQSLDLQTSRIAEEERAKIGKAESMLIQALGLGNATVQLSLDMTFTNEKTTSLTYDADGKVANDEVLENTTTTAKATPRLAGTASNIPTERGSNSTGTETKTENVKTKYSVPETEKITQNTNPIKNSMTVSVLVNSNAESVKQEDGTLSPTIKDQVTLIVQNAVGFEDDTDKISVEFLPFVENEFFTDEAALPFDWTQINEIIRNASLAIAAMVALLIGFLVLRKMKPGPPASVPGVRLDSDRSNSINQLGELVKNNPEIFNQIIQNWANAPAADASTVPMQTKGAA